MAERTGYSALQIGLHWVIAVLIFAAYMTSDGMDDAVDMRVASGATGTDGNTIHVWIGGAVFLLILIRVIVRLTRGAPPHSQAAPPWMQQAAHWGHRLIYALLIAVPALGAAAWYGGIEAMGDVHELAGQALIIVAFGHAIMAIVHEAWLGDGTIARMMRPGD